MGKTKKSGNIVKTEDMERSGENGCTGHAGEMGEAENGRKERCVCSETRELLFALADEGYRKFNSGLIPGASNIIGVRMPALRKLAMKTAKGNWRAFLACYGLLPANIAYSPAAAASIPDQSHLQADSEYRTAEPMPLSDRDFSHAAGGFHAQTAGYQALAEGCWPMVESEFFEEIMLQGMVIGYARADFEEKLQYVASYIPKITNWALCDSFCTSLRVTGENKRRMWNFLQPYLASEAEFEVRFGVVMMLAHFINEDYLERVLKLMDSIRHKGYYARMAVAWTVSVCFARFPNQTLCYLKDNMLDDFTYNKALQKIIESNQADDETKRLIRNMKRKKGNISRD